MQRVKISSELTYTDLEKRSDWCKTQFGNHYERDINTMIHNNSRWAICHNHYGFTFAFLNDDDAVWFKLVFSDNDSNRNKT